MTVLRHEIECRSDRSPRLLQPARVGEKDAEQQMIVGRLRVHHQRPLQVRHAEVGSARVVVQPAEAAPDGNRRRIEFDGALPLRQRFWHPAHRREIPGVPLPRAGVARIELDRSAELPARRLPVPVMDEQHPRK